MENKAKYQQLFEFGFEAGPIMKASLERTASRINKLNINDFVNKELFLPSTHLFGNPGKLLRPALLFSSVELLGERPLEYVDLAVSIELLHTASLVHDDIIDRDTGRRGVEAVHRKYGTEAAILAGDALIAKAIQLASPYGKDVVNAISKSAMQMCAGEMLDYSFQSGKKVPDFNSYLKIAKHKSGALIATAMSIVDIYKKGKSNSILHKAGESLGTAFQMRDDILNYLGLEERKKSYSDVSKFRPNIITTFMKHMDLTQQEAIRRGIDVNNSMVSEATGFLSKLRDSENMIKYADMVRVKPLGE